MVAAVTSGSSGAKAARVPITDNYGSVFPARFAACVIGLDKNPIQLGKCFLSTIRGLDSGVRASPARCGFWNALLVHE